MEIQILDLFQKIHTPAFTAIMKVIATLGDAGIVWIILTVILLLIPKTRKAGNVVAISGGKDCRNV